MRYIAVTVIFQHERMLMNGFKKQDYFLIRNHKRERLVTFGVTLNQCNEFYIVKLREPRTRDSDHVFNLT